MPAIGITGGISTGKSTFSKCLHALLPDARFFDADKAARLLTDEDTEVRAQIRQTFGPEIYSEAGHLNRAELRAIILRSAANRVALEQILHPRIRSQWSAEAQRYRNSSDFFFADIPLLYETGNETLCERVAVVACSHKMQLDRLVKRISLTGSEAEQMINSQMPLEEKIKRADHVVWNNGDRATLMEQAKGLVALWQEQTWKKS